MNPKERKLKLKKKRRTYDSLKSLFSSFAVTVCAVVIAVAVIPSSPKAEILGLSIFENQIVYQVEITDEDNALRLDTLKIVLENQMESYEYPLSLGINVGIFEDLSPGTPYKLSVVGSKGFGEERLTTKKVTTENNPGGAIVSYEIIDQSEFDFTYEARIVVNGLNEQFKEVNLYVGYAFPDEPIDQYKIISINGNDQLVTLDQIPNYHTIVNLYLEAITQDDEIIILDELQFYTPFDILTSIYLESVTKSSMSFQIYPDSYLNDVTYSCAIYLDDRLIQSKDIVLDENYMHYDGININFSNLRIDTSYQVKLTAQYHNPQTLRYEKKVLYDETISTLGTYTITYDIVETANTFEVTIDVSDPHHYFQVPYYTVYDVSGEFPIYIDGMNMGFTPLDTHKYVTFIISKPVLASYELIIGIKSQSEFTINHIIFQEIMNN
jgi:hypothetical protein